MGQGKSSNSDEQKRGENHHHIELQQHTMALNRLALIALLSMENWNGKDKYLSSSEIIYLSTEQFFFFWVFFIRIRCVTVCAM